jgi:hypothetical protein
VQYCHNHFHDDPDWETFLYGREDLEGVVGFIDGFMAKGVGFSLQIFSLSDEEINHVADWSLKDRAIDYALRLEQIRMAAKTLLCK